MPGTETKHKVRDVNVRMLRGGSGPPLLFLHGANGLPVWLPVFDLLAKQFEVFVPEHPGFGTSDNPPWIRNIGDLAMYYLDFLEEFGPQMICVNSAADWGESSPSMLTDTCLEYLRRGHSEREAMEIFYNNPCRFFGQSAKWTRRPVDMNA